MYAFLRFPGFKKKAFTLSYDDGTIHDKKFVELIDKYGLKCTFNLNSDLKKPFLKAHRKGAVSNVTAPFLFLKNYIMLVLNEQSFSISLL